MDKQQQQVINVVFILFVTIHIAVQTCKISEFACRIPTNCLPLDKYCDGKDDCGDGSDEPKFCTGMFLVNICCSFHWSSWLN